MKMTENDGIARDTCRKELRNLSISLALHLDEQVSSFLISLYKWLVSSMLRKVVLKHVDLLKS
jgi:hypothetical protein